MLRKFYGNIYIYNFLLSKNNIFSSYLETLPMAPLAKQNSKYIEYKFIIPNSDILDFRITEKLLVKSFFFFLGLIYIIEFLFLIYFKFDTF